MSLLIKSATPPDFTKQNWLPTVVPNVYLGDGYTPAPAGAVVIAQDGVVLNQAEYLAIRPLGNDAGQATGPLEFHKFMGEEQRLAGDPLASDPIERAYPADNLPFAIEVRHKLFTGNANPEWDGWGWRAEIVGGAASRDPSARAIGIYHNADDVNVWYTTGAFTQQQSAWQVDTQGQPLTVWATEYNPAFLTGTGFVTPQTTHHACLFGSIVEGRATLRADQQSAYHEFWQHDQGYVPPPVATWVDTGLTVIAIAGQLYRLSGIPTGLTINQPLRLGPTLETKFNGYWPTVGTPSDYIQITPYVSVTVGTKLWKWA